MAFTSKNVVIGSTITETVTEQPQVNNNSSELELPELEFLLKVLGNADLKGHQVEMFYNMIVKLQNLYLKKSGKQ